MTDNNSGQGDPVGPKTGMGIEEKINAYALLIGVGRCQYSEWSLPVTKLDALKLRETLADPGLCAYPAEQVRILSDEGATREGIIAAIDQLAQKAAKDPDSTVLVYYSGHGWRHTGADDERFFLIPHDVKPHDLTSSALPAEDFIRSLRSLRSQRVLVMIDTCHASGMADAKDPALVSIPKGFVQEPLPKELVEGLGTGEGRAVFLSCGEAQKSWILPGEGSLSIFTHHLLAALQGAGSAPEDSTVTVSSLMSHLGKAVPESAREIGQEQTPFFKLEAENFPVALIRGGKGLPTTGGEVQAPAERPMSVDSSVNVGTVKAGRNVVVAHQVGTVK